LIPLFKHKHIYAYSLQSFLVSKYNVEFFQEQDIHGVSVKNYTTSVVNEVHRIQKEQKNISNLITVVIGE
jgi:hypothetical protein